MARLMPTVECIDSAANGAGADERQACGLPGMYGDPIPEPDAARSGTPPWLARMNAILGLYEFAGAADNPAILGMARACGGNIARTYKHDATPWCALAVNYCLVASGLPVTQDPDSAYMVGRHPC